MSGWAQEISNTMWQPNIHSGRMVTWYMSRNFTFCLGMPLNTPCSLCATVTSQNSWMWKHTRLSGGRCAWLASACCNNRNKYHFTTASWQNRKSIYSTKLVLGLWDFTLLEWCKWGLRSSATLHSVDRWLVTRYNVQHLKGKALFLCLLQTYKERYWTYETVLTIVLMFITIVVITAYHMILINYGFILFHFIFYVGFGVITELI